MWQAYSPDTFTYAYRSDNAKRTAGIRSDNILFWGAIQQVNRETMTGIFRQAENEDNTKCKI